METTALTLSPCDWPKALETSEFVLAVRHARHHRHLKALDCVMTHMSGTTQLHDPPEPRL